MFGKYQSQIDELKARIARLEEATKIGPPPVLGLMTNRDIEFAIESGVTSDEMRYELIRRRNPRPPGRAAQQQQ